MVVKLELIQIAPVPSPLKVQSREPPTLPYRRFDLVLEKIVVVIEQSVRIAQYFLIV